VSIRIRIRKGLDIPIAGEPQQSVHPGPRIRHVALCGPDYIGLKPRLLVAQGEPVALGQPLFIDKRDPAVKYVSPGRGTVTAINRGVRRALDSVVVRLEDPGAGDRVFEACSDSEIERLDRERAATRLQESGFWPAFRTRPYSRVPHTDSSPEAIFVTAMDTRPLAADPRLVIRAQAGAFGQGLHVMASLTQGAVYLCSAPGWDMDVPDIGRLQTAEFSGPHPAGLAGTHIHHLHPAGVGRTVWHIGYQDVIAIGKLFAAGTIDTRRVIALGGDCVTQPRLVSVRLGASIDEIVDGRLNEHDSPRVISGSVLGGRIATGSLGFLGRYHDQVSVVLEGGDQRLFGWAGFFSGRFTASATFLKSTGHKRKFGFSTAQNGRFSGMLPLRVFERVTPLDILPSPLFRAMMVRDTDQAQALGCLELDEEDLALCSFVCPAKSDYGAALRLNLEQIEREG